MAAISIIILLALLFYLFLFPENETQEKQSIIRALKICTGNRKRTAEMLHIDPSTLYRKMKKYGLNDK